MYQSWGCTSIYQPLLYSEAYQQQEFIYIKIDLKISIVHFRKLPYSAFGISNLPSLLFLMNWSYFHPFLTPWPLLKVALTLWGYRY